MSLEHPQNKTYIRFLRIMELLIMFPIATIIMLFIDPKGVFEFQKETFTEWVKWFKTAQDFEYHSTRVAQIKINLKDQ